MPLPASPPLAFRRIADRPDVADVLRAVAAGASERDRERRLPLRELDLIRRAGLGAIRFAPEDGGQGATLRELFAFVIALAQADPSVAQILRTHYLFVEDDLLRRRANPSARKWTEQIAAGAIFGNASTELGARPVGVTGRHATTLTPAAHGHVLDGVKYYTTGSLFADRITVRASTPEGETVVAVVPADREGVTVEDDWDGFGQQVSGSGTTRLRDVAVADDEVLPAPEIPGAQTNRGTFLELFLTAVVAGVAQAVVDDAVALVRGRERTYSHAVTPRAADDPQLLEVVGRLAADADASEAAVLAAADALDAAGATIVDGVPERERALEAARRTVSAKVVVDELAQRAASRLFDVAGASATSRARNLDRHWRNARTVISHNPASYKARAVGDLLVNGTALPANGFF